MHGIGALTPVVAVALGGAVGALCRWGVSSWLGANVHAGHIPWGTLVVNVVGSAVLAALVALTLGDRGFSAPLNLALGTGLCGALTTFSTFSLEAVLLARSGAWSAAGIYIALNLLLCLGVTAVTLSLLWKHPA